MGKWTFFAFSHKVLGKLDELAVQIMDTLMWRDDLPNDAFGKALMR